MSLSDETIKKMFIEIQNKLADDHRQLQGVSAQIQANERDIRVSELTQKELLGLSDTTSTYRSIGKMFMLESKDLLCKELTLKVSERKTQQEALAKKKAYLERNIQEATSNIREVLQKSS